MTLHRFLVSGPLSPDATGVLSPEQSRQVRSVLRLREGSEIVLFDGSGVEASAVLTGSNGNSIGYRVEDLSYPVREPEVVITVGLALLRGEHFEIAIQKLSEIGVRRIVPLTADRCVVRYRTPAEWEKKAVRYRRIIVEALEQSERVMDTVLEPPVTLDELLLRQPAVVLTERSGSPPITLQPVVDDMTLAIGPEGGWSERERELIAAHASEASLGGLILRADTAAIVAAAAVIHNHTLGQTR